MNSQVLHGTDSSQLAMMQNRLVLNNRMRTGIGWFYWIAGLSLVNTAAYLFGITWTFIAGLGVTQIIDGIMSLLAKDLGEGWAILRAAGVGIDLCIAAAFVLIGYFGRKGHRWPIITGMVLYALDAVLLLLFKDFLGAAFHGWALYGIWSGLKAMQRLRVLEKSAGEPSPGTLTQQLQALEKSEADKVSQQMKERFPSLVHRMEPQQKQALWILAIMIALCVIVTWVIPAFQR